MARVYSTERFRCGFCQRLLKGFIPSRGDGTGVLIPEHKDQAGKRCCGTYDLKDFSEAVSETSEGAIKPPGEQRCSKCGIVKPASEFWIDRQNPGYLVRHCKPCMRRDYREKRYPKIKTTDTYKKQRRVREKKYRDEHPEVAAAHSAASRNKKTLKKDCCERCGSTDRLHMHHPDYSQPLLVVTLCNPCHEATHHPGAQSYG